MILLALLLVVLAPSFAHAAACPGSDLAFSCPSGTTIAEVNDTITASSDGAIITFAAGSYTWNSGSISLVNAKGTTLICAVEAACEITAGTNSVILGTSMSGTNAKLYRISGFTFFLNGTCSTACIWLSGTPTMTAIRVDRNTIVNNSGASIFLHLGQTATVHRFYGVMDHNTVTGATASILLVKVMGPLEPANVPSPLRGTANNFFVEDNVIDFEVVPDDSLGCLDAWNSSGVVWRFNTSTNCRIVAHGVTHGGGAMNYEVYRNTLRRDGTGLTNCYRTIHHQGSGEAMVFDNTLDCSAAISASAIALLHYRDSPTPAGPNAQCDGTLPIDGNTSPEATYRGYPCWHQPGHAPAGGSPAWGTLSPMGFFRNTNVLDGSKVDVLFECPWSAGHYCAEHVLANRDYYNAVSATAQTSASSPFDGTTGIGHGTLANRPMTCTHTTAPDGDEGGGVMYWATDQGSWNQAGDDGVLYRCSATNTWTTHYTPYTYPHPLQGFIAGSGAGVKGSKGMGLF